MSEKQPSMTPARVLEEYNIPDVSKRLIAEMRNRFVQLEQQGEHAWKILVDEVADIDFENLEEQKTIDQNRLWIAKQCADIVLSESKRLRQLSKRGWQELIQNFSTPNEFLSLFILLGLESDWRNGKSVREAGLDTLYLAITSDKRFNGWISMVQFVDANALSVGRRIALCDTPDLLREYLLESRIKLDSRITYSSLGKNLADTFLRDDRFDSIDDLNDYLRIEDNSQEALFDRTHEPEALIKLFMSFGLSNGDWLKAGYLQRNKFKWLYKRIVARYGNWKVYEKFIGHIDNTLKGKIARCLTADDFILLLKELGLLNLDWKNTGELFRKGFYSFFTTLTSDPRFPLWQDFLNLMDPEFIQEVQELDRISELKIEDAISLLGSTDPFKLKLYLQATHAELDELEVDKLVTM